MTQLSDELATKLADLVFRGTAYTPPTAIYMGVHENDPLDDDSGTELSAVNGYARQLVTFDIPANRVVSSNAGITFSATGGNWNEITHSALYSSQAVGSGGLLSRAKLDTPQTVLDGEQRTFVAGNINVEFKDGISNFLANALLNHVFRAVAYSPAANVYLTHYSDDPTAADIGTELSGNAYARIIATWAAAVNGFTETAAQIDWPTATPAGQGVASYWGTRDALTGGNLLTFGAWAAPTNVLVDKFLQLPASNLAKRFS